MAVNLLRTVPRWFTAQHRRVIAGRMGESRGCPDCRDRVQTLWLIAVETGRQELDPDWETRCRRCRGESGENTAAGNGSSYRDGYPSEGSPSCRLAPPSPPH